MGKFQIGIEKAVRAWTQDEISHFENLHNNNKHEKKSTKIQFFNWTTAYKASHSVN